MTPNEVAQRLDELSLEVPSEFSAELLSLAEELVGAMEDLTSGRIAIGSNFLDTNPVYLTSLTSTTATTPQFKIEV